MFKDENNEEVSFSDAYKAEILGNVNNEDEETRSLMKVVIILLLIAIIIGLAIFGYLYFSDKETESDMMPPETSQMIDNIEDLEEESLSEDINTSSSSEANVSSIPKTETQTALSKIKVTPKEELKPESSQKGEDTYLEQLAELSKEIDGEK